MRIRLLGTGGADGIPAYCSDSPVSSYAREHGGKDVRTRAAALIDGHLKVDFGPDTLAQIQRDQLDPCDWTATLFTHSDEDHLCVGEFQYFLYPFNDREFMDFQIYGNAKVCEIIRRRYPEWPMEVNEIETWKPFDHMGYRITPLLANHKTDEDALNFVIEKDGKKLIYATDTGVWNEPTFEAAAGLMVDALVIECTEGFALTDYWGHLDINECLDMVSRMRKLDVVSDHARIVTTHHSHQGNARHCDLVKTLGKHAIEVGYDGLEFEI